MTEEKEILIESLLDIVASGSPEEARLRLLELHPADVASALRGLAEEESLWLFSCLDDETAADVLAEADEDLVSLLTGSIPEQELSDILEEMEPDDAADVVGDIEDEDRARRVLDLMADLERDEVEGLLAHDEETAGGIMTSEFLAFPDSWSVSNTIQFLRQAPPEINYNTSFLLDENGRYKGFIQLQKLIWTDPTLLLRELADSEAISVTPDMDQEDVAKLFTRYDLIALPVVDQDGHLTGRITVDDVLDVVEEEHSEDMLMMAGTTEDELVTRSARTALKLRLPWMLGGLFLGAVCTFILKGFEEVLEQSKYVAFYLPVIMSMGGNIGSQSSTVVVRGLATGQIDAGHLLRTIFREVRVGFLMGIACGSIAGTLGATFAWWTGDPATIGLVLAVSMLISMTLAACFASIIPLTFSKLGIDPAVASGPLITMSNDALSLVIYMGMFGVFNEYIGL